MKILFAASEAVPYVKTGGLGDVAYALPCELAKRDDVEICVILPYYKSIKENPSLGIEYITHFYMPLAWRTSYVGIFRAYNADKKLTYYFIDNDYYFNRDSIYGDYDDGERFTFFSKAILECIQHIGFYPDIIHCNDWQRLLFRCIIRRFLNTMTDTGTLKQYLQYTILSIKAKCRMNFFPR